MFALAATATAILTCAGCDQLRPDPTLTGVWRTEVDSANALALSEDEVGTVTGSTRWSRVTGHRSGDSVTLSFTHRYLSLEFEGRLVSRDSLVGAFVQGDGDRAVFVRDRR